eukprot:3683834-Rhodomonas_salina.1
MWECTRAPSPKHKLSLTIGEASRASSAWRDAISCAKRLAAKRGKNQMSSATQLKRSDSGLLDPEAAVLKIQPPSSTPSL